MSDLEPYIIKRGADLNLVMLMPDDVPSGHFSTYIGSAQIRKYQDSSEEGLIDNLEFNWIVPEEALSFALMKTGTEDWPLGLAELDVFFTSTSGGKVSTKTMLMKIERNITRSV